MNAASAHTSDSGQLRRDIRRFVRVAGARVLTICLLQGCQGKLPSKIIFQSTRDGNFEIYSMNADGSDQVRLTNNPANDVNPSLSPDGSMITFASDRDGNWEIYSMRTDGTQQMRLTQNRSACTSPSWAMRGSKILFVSTFDAPNGNVFLMNADGGGIEPVTADSLVKDSPVLSPDGRFVIATVNTRGRYRIGAYARAEKVWHLLTPDNHNSLHPSLSRDGSQILFASDRDGSYKIYSMDNLGVGQKCLTTNTAGDLYPAWTDNAGEILLTRTGSIYRRWLTDGREKLLTFRGDGAPSCTLQ